MSMIDRFREDEQISALLLRYQQLPVREKWLLQGLLAFLCLVFVYFILVNPFLNAKAEASKQLSNAQIVYDNAQELVPEILLAKQTGAKKPSSQQSLRSLFNLYSQSNQIKASRTDENDNILTVEGQSQSFESIITMIAQLEDKEAVRVNSLKINNTDSLGKIDYIIQFTR